MPSRSFTADCMPLLYDSLDWSPEQFRLAAAVAGEKAAHLLMVHLRLRADAAVSGDYAEGMVAAILGDAVDLARDAWHFARRAEELGEGRERREGNARLAGAK